MKKYIITKIIHKYLSGRFPAETEKKVQQWIIKEKNNKEKENASFNYWNKLNVKSNSETYIALERVNKRINYKKREKSTFYRNSIRIAAVWVLLLIPVGGYWSYITHSAIKVSVAYGEKKHLFLPDSSEVWLNAGTSIKYPRKFKKGKRLIQLDGEAYFSVKKDKSKPFIVETKQLHVKVLGTQFNIKAYSNEEKAITTLTSGKVEVSTLQKDTRILTPNKQLVFHTNTSKVEVTEISPSETDSWIKGELIFSNAPLKEIIQTLERHFNIPIIDHTETTFTQLYTIKFIESESLEEIMSVLQDFIGFTYEIQPDNKIRLN